MLEDEKLNTRKRAHAFALKVISFCQTLPNQRIYWTIVDQLIRSSMSIGANLFEAIAAASRKDFINYYQMALKSANETLYWLYILRDSSLEEVDREIVQELILECDQLCKMIGKSIISLKKS